MIDIDATLTAFAGSPFPLSRTNQSRFRGFVHPVSRCRHRASSSHPSSTPTRGKQRFTWETVVRGNSGSCSWRDVHVDDVAGAGGVGVALRPGVREGDPERVGRRFAGGVKAVAVAEPPLPIRDDLVEDPPAPALPNFHVESHTLWWIWPTGHCAGPVDCVLVAGAMGGDPELDPGANPDRCARARRRAGVVAEPGVGELQCPIRSSPAAPILADLACLLEGWVPNRGWGARWT